jgi:glycosyltransferase involved in cell wall biosynthesis
MTKILTICIPTYKRPLTLRNCIGSIIEQVEKYGLSNDVDIYVANDASPDETVSLLSEYEGCRYFSFVNRIQNQGMNVNIKLMLTEVAGKSEYQLIITDDDYLQPNVLLEIVDFLHARKNELLGVFAIWTPRYSYKENGDLYCVACSPFKSHTLVKPSAFNSARYMVNGFVLSGLFVSARQVDFEFWESYTDNAYFPIIFFGDLIYNNGAYFWNCNIVHHTVLNKCHWESWGKSDLLIEIKKFSDSINAYKIMNRKITGSSDSLKFYFASFPSIFAEVAIFISSDHLKVGEKVVIEAMEEQRNNGVFILPSPLKELVMFSLVLNLLVIAIKFLVLQSVLVIARNEDVRKNYLVRKSAYKSLLWTIPKIATLLLQKRM